MIQNFYKGIIVKLYLMMGLLMYFLTYIISLCDQKNLFEVIKIDQFNIKNYSIYKRLMLKNSFQCFHVSYIVFLMTLSFNSMLQF